MSLRRNAAVAAGVATAAGMAYVLERSGARKFRATDADLARAGRTLPVDLRHHFVPVGDGGRIHVVERGQGPVVVLVHGITLGVATWAPQLRSLPGRVIAVSQRGHGQSRAGADGYGFDRLGTDLLEVLAALDVDAAVLVGHSMGGMVVQQLAVERPHELGRHVRRLVLMATGPGPVAPARVGALAAGGAARVMAAAERRGRGPVPRGLTVWAARAAFGAAPQPADVALVAEMLDAMSPAAMAGLLPHLLAFDVRAGLPSIGFPVHALVGTRDVLTPPRTARAIVHLVSGAGLTVLPGCGHMVMLERPEALGSVLAGSAGHGQAAGR